MKEIKNNEVKSLLLADLTNDAKYEKKCRVFHIKKDLKLKYDSSNEEIINAIKKKIRKPQNVEEVKVISKDIVEYYDNKKLVYTKTIPILKIYCYQVFEKEWVYNFTIDCFFLRKESKPYRSKTK